MTEFDTSSEVFDNLSMVESRANHLRGTLLLSLMALCERISYYGVRAIIILYAVDPEGLGVEREISLSFYSAHSALLLFLPIPLGFLIDKVIKQKKAILIGGILSLCGYLLLLINSVCLLLMGLLLVALGTSMVKPSTTILIGRQFKKENRKRSLSYFIFFLAINAGAFLGISIIGYVGEMFSWTYGFLIGAAFTLAYLLMFLFTRHSIKEIEENTLVMKGKVVTLRDSLLFICLLLFIYVVFYKSWGLLATTFSELTQVKESSIMGYHLPIVSIDLITAIWYYPASFFILIFWFYKGVGKTYSLFILSLLVLVLAILGVMILMGVTTNLNLGPLIIFGGLVAIAEVLFSPLITSYLTRISDINYSNTIYGVFYFLGHLLIGGLSHIIPIDINLIFVVIALVLIIVVMLGFRNQFYAMNKGID